jgi:hypothetical protein
MIVRNLSGMFLLRYGSNVTVWSNDAEYGGVDENRFANLREHDHAYIYYFDDSKLRHEVPVDPVTQTTASPALPVRFQAPIRLQGYELTSAALKRGNDLGLLLYWDAEDRMEKDYTVFVHLVNDKGETVLGEDSQPRGGRLPTSQWALGKMVIDAHMITLPPDILAGKYYLEVGLYYFPTRETVNLLDDKNRPVTDRIVIEPFVVEE